MMSATSRVQRSVRSAGATPDPVSQALRRPRMGLIAATLAQKRAEYPTELGATPALATLRAIAARERIHVRYANIAPIQGVAMRFAWAGCVVNYVQLDRALPHEMRRRILAHELAHLWLNHHAPVLTTWRTEERTSGDSKGARRGGVIEHRTEEEADLLAAALLGLSLAAYRAPIDRYCNRLERRRIAEAGSSAMAA